MSRYDYLQSREIAALDHPFYAIVMAAMRRADTDNLELLRDVFPRVFTELYERYNAPGGWLPEDEGCPLSILEAMEKGDQDDAQQKRPKNTRGKEQDTD